MGSAACSKKTNVASESVQITRSNTHFTAEMRKRTFTELSELSEAPLIPWRKGELIGEGTFAKVYQCLSLTDGKLLAVKSIQMDADSVEKVKREVQMLRQLSHKNIVKYIQTDVGENSVNIVMEYISGGSLRALVSQYAGFSEKLIQYYAAQILEGLAYLHANNIVHRDLKGANILLSPDGVIKLTDFGSSARLSQQASICLSIKGSPYWMAPEVVNEEGHTTKADIWSFGCVLIEMRIAKAPWSDEAHEAGKVLKLIQTPDRKH